MTSYFDEKYREIETVYTDNRLDETLCLELISKLEMRVATDVRMVVGDREFPCELRERALRILALWRTFAVHSIAPRQEAIDWLFTMGSSRMLGELHEFFHDVARRRIQVPYGLLTDSPSDILTRRHVWETEKYGAGKITMTERMDHQHGQESQGRHI